ncbi:hypothetical protein MTR67_005357 [Solanum verrucosum]|uniref:Lipoxygenase n=1 Tax=Solanum verrucosum TaxID=315347 RepID=A0AAF0PW60_SOLVR|nr:hypothetical protein MTR67_005357 [Solanum verrucosum]
MASTCKLESKKINGTVVLVKKRALELVPSEVVQQQTYEILGDKVILQLISSVNGDSENKGKLGNPTHLRDESKVGDESKFSVTFDLDEEFGAPGAFIIKNFNPSEFFLKKLTLEVEVDDPSHGGMHFVCNSWVYPAEKYKSDHIFFVNQAWLPSETPVKLRWYREEELLNLRGNGIGKLEEWDRVYDYAYYNDLGDPEKGSTYVRPILGGSTKYPYPRRGRTSRPPTKTDPNSESRLPLLMSFGIYVPRDEKFAPLKMTDFIRIALKVIVQLLVPELESLGNINLNEFNSFEDILKIYGGGINLPEDVLQRSSIEMIKEFIQSSGQEFLKYPMPQFYMVATEDKSAWRTDEEFAREMLAGINPVCICGLKEFPPTSKLDPKVYGDQTSNITREHIQNQLDGLTIEEAIKVNQLFILNHHDTLMPYMRQINMTSTKIYASRTLLFLQKDGTLKLLGIELSLPHPDGDQHGFISKVFTPQEYGTEASIWQLAKAYVAVNDSGVHQLISHWLHTHATIEPIVIATNRQLSVLHPIYKLLHPHFRDTMHINALARQTLLNAGGILEQTVFPTKYAMEMTSAAYKDWVFPEQALPADLIKRGVAIEDPESEKGIRLLIQDYPYAVDGLEIWSAIKSWVQEYCTIYYKTDDMIQKDTELQAWWKELQEEGHGDKKDEPWWPKMQTLKELTDSCTIIIWIASALHAAINFGQYPYGGYLPNRPSMSRRLMPEPGSPEFEELKTNPEKGYLSTITPQLQTLIGISAIEILSTHSSDEIYLGQRDTPEWTNDKESLQALERFGKKLTEIEEKIIKMNNDKKWKNRMGPIKMPYTLLYPLSDTGLTGKGIPNSVSI